jgi:hypothetical protein
MTRKKEQIDPPKMNILAQYVRDFIIDCQEAGLLTKQIAERKLEQIKLYEETLVKHIMDQNSNKKEPDNMNMVNNIMNESNDLDIVSNVLDNTN